MKRKYICPLVNENNSKLRTSLLAGSNGAFNGTSKGDVSTPPSMSIEGARKRVNFEM